MHFAHFDYFAKLTEASYKQQYLSVKDVSPKTATFAKTWTMANSGVQCARYG